MSEMVTLTTHDGGTMDAYVARPNTSLPRSPGIIVFQEAFGVNAHIRDVTDRFAEIGFTAIAPELFHRTARGFEGSYTDYPAIAPHMIPLTREALEADADAAHAWLSAETRVDAARIAAVGFCLGGKATYLANARHTLCAAVSFYGGGIVPDLLPLAAQQHGPILMFWGGLDAHIVPEHYRAVADALTHEKKTHEQVIFGQADHGFFNNKKASYNAHAAPQAWALLQAFFNAYGVLT